MEKSINTAWATIKTVFWVVLLSLNLLLTTRLISKLRQAEQRIAKLTLLADKADDLAKHTLKTELENKRLKTESDACKAVLKNFGKWVKP